MASVIDALVVTLSLDPKAYNAGSKAAKIAMQETSAEAKKAAAEIEARGQQAAMFFSKLRNEALALAAIFTAGVGMKSFIQNTVGGAASLGLMAKNLDMSTESLSAWEKANQRTGGTAEGIVAQLKESAQELAKVKMGRSSEAATEFYRMGGVDVRNFKDGNEFLLERSRILADIYSKDPARAMVVANRMGISEDAFNLLKQGPAAVMALVDAQRKNSQVTEEQAAQALKLANAWLDFKDRINVVATQIILRLEPSFNRILAKLQSLADWIADHQDDIARWLDRAVDALTRFGTAADNAAQAVGGWKVILAGLLGLKLAGMAAGLITLAGALGGVGASLGIIGALGPAALAALAAVGVYVAADAMEPTADAGPMRQGEKVGTPRDPKELPSARELWLRTLASTGRPEAAKELYQLTGKNDYPAVWTPEKGTMPKPGPEKYKQGEGGIGEMFDRTLASLGNVNAGIRIKNATGIDSYNVGDAKLDDQPKARTGIAGGRALRDLPVKQVLPAPGNAPMTPSAGGSQWQIPPGVQAERDKDRLQILQDELAKATSPEDRAALEREIARTKSSIGKLSLPAPVVQSRNGANSVNPSGAMGGGQRGGTSTTEVNVNGPISITAPGADPESLAGSMARAIKNKIMAAQSNTGLN